MKFKREDRVRITSGINKDETGRVIRTPPEGQQRGGYYLIALNSSGDVVKVDEEEIIKR